MKKLSFFACSAFAALMFAACSDDSVTGAVPPAGGGQGGGTALDSTRNMSVNLKGCFGSPYDALTKTAATNPKAYLVVDEAGYHVVLSNIVDACGYADIVFNNQRVLDTLKVNFEANSTDCMCYTDEWFTIDPLDADIKYFVYQGTVYEVVKEPLPVRSSSSNAAVSSSSEVALSSAVVSSSSETPTLSSSSVPVESSSSAVTNPSHVKILDAVAQCGANGIVDDPMVDGATPVQKIRPKDEDYALPPVTYRYVGTERTGFTIENVTMTCGVKIVSLDVYASGDTVYVNGEYDNTNALRCLCPSKVNFAVGNDPAYSRARWLVFDGRVGSYDDAIEIVDMDVITIEEVMTQQMTTDIEVECKNDRRTLDKPSLANSTLLPVLDTASTKQIYAMRFDNGDNTETITINELDVGCGVNDVQFDVYAYNDTLYVKSSSELYATNCICPSRVDFTIKKGLRFTDTHYLVFDRREAMPLVVAKQ